MLRRYSFNESNFHTLPADKAAGARIFYVIPVGPVFRQSARFFSKIAIGLIAASALVAYTVFFFNQLLVTAAR